jgi:hydroxypyruvate reductase
MSTRDTLLAIFEAGVNAARPATCVPPHLPPPPERGRVILLGTGKCGAALAAAAEAHYLDVHGLPRHRLDGVAVCRHGYAVPTRAVPVMEAGHPVPDTAGLVATSQVLALADGAGPDDLVVALLSGGGSANWVAPRGAITLDEKRALTKVLQRAGATIDELNCVRKHLSEIKGGRLAARASPARVVSLAISDVPRDDPSVIASGPTVPDPTTLAEARAVLAKYRVTVSASVAAALADPRSETPKPGDPAFAGAPYTVICRPTDMLAAAVTSAERAGYRTLCLGPDIEGEAREVAAAHAALAKAEQGRGGKVAIISGGELTVTVTGNGRGGPNQEYVLAAAAAGISALAADTDGTDGGGGSASDPAGALVFPDTLARARALGLDPALRLSHNDATGFFEPLGDLVAPGPTMTNVNDLRVVLVDPA